MSNASLIHDLERAAADMAGKAEAARAEAAKLDEARATIERTIFAASPADVLVVLELDAYDCEAAAAAHQVMLADREGRH